MKNQIGDILAGAICAVPIFVFVILPQIEFVEAANVSDIVYLEESNPDRPGPCHLMVGGACELWQDRCVSGVPEGEFFCLYYE